MSLDQTFTDSDRAMLSARVDQFHADLGKGSVADWEPYLLRLPRLLRRRVLVELALVHLAHEWKAGRQPTVEEYLARFPELGPDVPELLVVEEYRCRRAAGAPAEPEGFVTRFPKLFPALADKLRAADREIATNPPSSATASAPLRGYEKVTWLGGGGFADVWLVRNANGQEKALKIVRDRMTSEAAQRERNALEQVKNLQHRCLLNTEDFWIENGQLHILSQLAEGSLKSRMEQCQQEEGLPGIPPEELFPYFCDAAAGLDYLHENRITHRDVKPDNILLVGGGAVVADFGLARKQASLLTQQSVFAGTMPYMAPELFGGEGGPPSDQYALALTYIHLRQGKHPLKVLPYPQIMTQHLSGEFELDPLISSAEWDALQVALAQAPTDRYPSCQDFARALGAALGLPFLDRRKRSTGPMPGLRQASAPPSASDLDALFADTKLPGDKTAGVPRRTGHEPTVRPSTTNIDLGRREAASDAPPTGRPSRKWMLIALVGVAVVALGGVLMLTLSGGKKGGSEEPPPNSVPVVANEGREIAPFPRLVTATPPVIPERTRLLPPGTEPFGGEATESGNQLYWTHVRLKSANAVAMFRFIPAALDTVGKRVAPFYLMESKVTNRLAASEKYADDTNPDAPAVGMTRAEAAAFASRLAPGGRLPTPAEWDSAAGCFARPRPSNLTMKGVPVVNVPAPVATRRDADTVDVNHFGLIDLAGNGCEWTTGDLPGGRAITRGRNFLFATPLTYALLEAEQQAPNGAFAEKGNKYTGFRVALDAPVTAKE